MNPNKEEQIVEYPEPAESDDAFLTSLGQLFDDYDFIQAIDSYIALTPDDVEISADNCDLVFFDLETSGFGARFHEILQIAAIYKEHEFSFYINPTREIHPDAALRTGLQNIAGQLYVHNKKVDTIPLRDALLRFLDFFNLSPKPCVLVAHNSRFDVSFLIRAIIQSNVLPHFQKIAGVCDTLQLFKKALFPRKEQFKLGMLAKDILNIEPNKNFHEALYDVVILRQLTSSVLKDDDIFKNAKTWITLLGKEQQSVKRPFQLFELQPLQGVLSKKMLEKMANEGITFEMVKSTFDAKGDNGIFELMSSEMDNGKPRITKNKRIINDVIQFLNTM